MKKKSKYKTNVKHFFTPAFMYYMMCYKILINCIDTLYNNMINLLIFMLSFCIYDSFNVNNISIFVKFKFNLTFTNFKTKRIWISNFLLNFFNILRIIWIIKWFPIITISFPWFKTSFIFNSLCSHSLKIYVKVTAILSIL